MTMLYAEDHACWARNGQGGALSLEHHAQMAKRLPQLAEYAGLGQQQVQYLWRAPTSLTEGDNKRIDTMIRRIRAGELAEPEVTCGWVYFDQMHDNVPERLRETVGRIGRNMVNVRLVTTTQLVSEVIETGTVDGQVVIVEDFLNIGVKKSSIGSGRVDVALEWLANRLRSGEPTILSLGEGPNSARSVMGELAWKAVQWHLHLPKLDKK
jgi:hypothetical protein